MPAPLGQHFLKTPGPARALVRALELTSTDIVVEVGPGHGELTRFLVEAPHARIICIERDVRLAAAVVRRFEGSDSVTVIHGDVREILAEVVADFPQWKLAGNIPYYLTSYLIRIIGDLPNPPQRAALLMQREVAERIHAKQGSFTKLAAFVGMWADTDIVANVPRTAFSPPPRVESAVLSFIRKNVEIPNRSIYEEIARRSFAQPRKVLLNNLLTKDITKDKLAEALQSVGLTPTSRPQDLSVEMITRLSTYPYWT